MTARLPQPRSEQEFDALDRTAPCFVEALREGFAMPIRALPIEATAVGSWPVFQVGERYVAKLFSPLHDSHFRAESGLLRLLGGFRAVPAPRLVETAELDGWGAILMTRVTGRSLKVLWRDLDLEQREGVCRDLGGIARALHLLDPRPLVGTCPDWDEFLAGQLRECVARQLRFGLSERLAGEIPEFLASLSFDTEARAVLHTELMPDHVFCERAEEGGIQITGLIDWEPAMIGSPEYEFASVGLFVAGGRANLLRAFLRGYGCEPDPQFHRRVMGYALLHRYSKLSWYLQFMPGGDTLEQLAENWFAIG